MRLNDPDSALREIRFFVAQRFVDRPVRQKLADADRLAYLVGGLDEWIGGGGSLPADWSRPDARGHDRG